MHTLCWNSLGIIGYKNNAGLIGQIEVVLQYKPTFLATESFIEIV